MLSKWFARTRSISRLKMTSAFVVVALVLAAVLVLSITAYRQANAAPSASFAQTLYGAGLNCYPRSGCGGSVLYELDQHTGAPLRTVGNLGYNITGLAVDPTTNIMYGVTGAQGTDGTYHGPGSCLVLRVHPTTAHTEVVGPEGTGCPIADIAFDATGRLYGWGEETDDLYVIKKSTGIANRVGESGIGTYGDGMAFTPGGTLLLMPKGTEGNMYTVNQYHGTVNYRATLHGFTGLTTCTQPPVSAADFNSAGVLYASVLDYCAPTVPRSYLNRVNPTTGQITTLGQSVNHLDGIAFYPATPITH